MAEKEIEHKNRGNIEFIDNKASKIIKKLLNFTLKIIVFI